VLDDLRKAEFKVTEVSPFSLVFARKYRVKGQASFRLSRLMHSDCSLELIYSKIACSINGQPFHSYPYLTDFFQAKMKNRIDEFVKWLKSAWEGQHLLE
jgi:hypothetical protein